MPITIKSTGGGSVTVQAPNTASDYTVNFPATNGDMVVAVSGAVPASQGGTGQTSLTANNVLLGNGTSAVQFVAPGTSGNVLTSNGTTWTSAAAASGFSNLQVFTSSGTFTVPTGITKVKVTVVGGGGGGGGWAGSYAQNGIGGSGGGTAIKIISGLTPGGTVSVTVGTGGAAGGTGATSRGGTGNTSSFGAYCSATGGAGGYNASQSGGNAPAGVGGSGSSGDINLNGGGPSWGVNPGGCNEGWNIGGVSFLGTGGINNSAGTDQSPIYGGGGAGASLSGASVSATGMQAGATGIVIVEY